MGFFDRFKRKKVVTNENNSSALSNEDELLRKYNEAMRSIDEQDAELERQWHRVDANVSNGMKNLENLPGNKKYNDLATKRARELQEEMRQKEFAKSLLGQKYENVRRYVQLKEMGLQPGANFSQEINIVALAMENRGYSSSYLLLPFLIEKKAKNLLTSLEENELDSIVGRMSDEELYKSLEDTIGLILYGGIFGTLKNDEYEEKSKRLFSASSAIIDNLQQKIEFSRR